MRRDRQEYARSPAVVRLREWIALGMRRCYASNRDIFSAWAAVSVAAAARGNTFSTFEVDP